MCGILYGLAPRSLDFGDRGVEGGVGGWEGGDPSFFLWLRVRFSKILPEKKK